jgi:uncharacterized protein
MRSFCRLAAAIAVVALGFAGGLQADDAKKRRLLLVTHSGGFIHDSVGVAEDVLKVIGPENGFEVTCFRYTGDPAGLEKYNQAFRPRTGKTVEAENAGRVNAETLKKFDVVLFFTTGSKRSNNSPLTDSELKDLMDWVKAGGAFAGTHCASDTLYDTPYGDLVGAFFRTHPPGTPKVKIHVEDPKHPAGKAFTDGEMYEDEIYIFDENSPYSRDKLHIILSIDPSSFNPPKGGRKDLDYAVSWCQEYGKGKSFYTSLGHRKEVWKDPKFQQHLIGGLKWATNQAPGDATPSAKLSKN